MEALYTSFLAAALAEWGDKTQLLAAALALHFRRPAPVFGGAAIGLFLAALMAAFGGILIHDMIVPRATSLLVAVALLYAGVAGFIAREAPAVDLNWKGGALLAALAVTFAAELGDKTQFLAFAIAAQYDSLVLTAFGATAGAVASLVPAVLLGDRLAVLLPMKALRLGFATLLLLGGFIVAVNALRLI